MNSTNQQIRFFKYHALGNDYLVLDPKDWARADAPSPGEIRKICHRHYGLGSDGILFGPLPADGAFGLRIFNPDGSEAEKSGNGLRIFSRYLYDQLLVKESPFRIHTPGGWVESLVLNNGSLIRVEMGNVSFMSDTIPVSPALPRREVLNETITVLDRSFTYCAATVGNPHCVIPVQKATAELARQYGPAIEIHSTFPKRTNVQFLEIIDRENIRIEIWERGAGYTFASGSSSSASAAVARKLSLCAASVTVHMPGGRLGIAISDDYAITMTGGVTSVGRFVMSPEVLQQAIEC
ncbi:MAG: diaminopimelate epimerase [Puniceicoccales bacterium]|jgi:diaminopimelate epimerase|nr:diaminopimelate epimerase [Puniceicoccales bacterium]